MKGVVRRSSFFYLFTIRGTLNMHHAANIHHFDPLRGPLFCELRHGIVQVQAQLGALQLGQLLKISTSCSRQRVSTSSVMRWLAPFTREALCSRACSAAGGSTFQPRSTIASRRRWSSQRTDGAVQDGRNSSHRAWRPYLATAATSSRLRRQ